MQELQCNSLCVESSLSKDLHQERDQLVAEHSEDNGQHGTYHCRACPAGIAAADIAAARGRGLRGQRAARPPKERQKNANDRKVNAEANITR